MRAATTDLFLAGGTADGPRSSIWHVWIPVGKYDIYVAPEGLTRVFKVSLHQSGQLQVGFAREFVEPGRPGALMGFSPRNRLLRKWTAVELDPKAQLLFRLGLPRDEMRARPCPATTAARTVFLAAPPAGHMLELGFFLVASKVQTVADRGPNRLVWNQPLSSGRSLSILVCTQPYGAPLKAQVEEKRRKVKVGSEGATHRLMVGGTTPDGLHFFVDASRESEPGACL